MSQHVHQIIWSGVSGPGIRLIKCRSNAVPWQINAIWSNKILQSYQRDVRSRGHLFSYDSAKDLKLTTRPCERTHQIQWPAGGPMYPPPLGHPLQPQRPLTAAPELPPAGAAAQAAPPPYEPTHYAAHQPAAMMLRGAKQGTKLGIRAEMDATARAGHRACGAAAAIPPGGGVSSSRHCVSS